jgi:hypothetical protein
MERALRAPPAMAPLCPWSLPPLCSAEKSVAKLTRRIGIRQYRRAHEHPISCHPHCRSAPTSRLCAGRRWWRLRWPRGRWLRWPMWRHRATHSPAPCSTNSEMPLLCWRLTPVFQQSSVAPPRRRRAQLHARKISSLRRQIDIVHKQCVNASLAECDDRVGGRADNWLAVVEGRIDEDRYSGPCKKAGYEIVKARI